MKSILILSIAILAGIGFLGAIGISYVHWIGESSCPILGVIPACYAVSIGYGLMIASMVPSMMVRPKIIFGIGWLPVIVLAYLGVGGELMGVAQCPHTETGIPKCYFSAILATIIGYLAWHLFKSKTKSSKQAVT